VRILQINTIATVHALTMFWGAGAVLNIFLFPDTIIVSVEVLKIEFIEFSHNFT